MDPVVPVTHVHLLFVGCKRKCVLIRMAKLIGTRFERTLNYGRLRPNSCSPEKLLVS